MSHFEKFITDGNEKADELAKTGAMLDEGFMAETRAKTVKQEGEEVYAALQYAASFHSLVKKWKDCEDLKLKPKRNVVPRGCRFQMGTSFPNSSLSATSMSPFQIPPAYSAYPRIEKRRNKTSNRMVCCGQQISVHEMWNMKMQRQIYRAEVFG